MSTGVLMNLELVFSEIKTYITYNVSKFGLRLRLRLSDNTVVFSLEKTCQNIKVNIQFNNKSLPANTTYTSITSSVVS